MTTLVPNLRRVVARTPAPRGAGGVAWLGGAELASGLIGFGATLHVGRRLGPEAFGRVEAAAAAAAWMLVFVRSGVETIVAREVARRSALIGPMTDALVGIKLACAAAAHLVLLVAAFGTGRPLLGVAGLVLWPSALVADVGARAGGRLRLLSMALVARSSAMLASAWLIRGPADAAVAALMATVGESIVGLICWLDHRAHAGGIRPRLRRRESLALCRRGLVASLIRFGRVGVYCVDLLVLGAAGGPDLGAYAAARRVAFAAIAVGLVVPTAYYPSLARSWSAGLVPARTCFRAGLKTLAFVGLPATIALLVVPASGISTLFGPSYGGPWLAILGSRVPFLLISTYAQSALIACRRDRVALSQSAWVCALAAVAVPAAAWSAGALGAGLAALGVEIVGASVGMLALRRLSLVGPESPP